MELLIKQERLTFKALIFRLIDHVNIRIQNGDFTERGLARVLGISQPHMHNVLKGARKLSSVIADRLLWKLEISVLDLMSAAELANGLTIAQMDSGNLSARVPMDIMESQFVPPAMDGHRPPRKPSSRNVPAFLRYKAQAS